MKARDNIMIALSSGDQRSKAMAATAMTLGLGNKSNAPGNQSMTSRAGNCFLVTVVIICVCIMVACGVMVVREYALAKGYEFSRCRVSDSCYVPFKGISRGPEALQSHLNDFYHTGVLCWPWHAGVLYTTGISHSDP